ncbi:MAG: hypothetical protein KZQ83_08905 [gamma proteobacterium symbiont of Taylorina sp.]|nr:hypothetical protein [gamma proteobacterium symbiont of Taylorina sp.]
MYHRKQKNMSNCCSNQNIQNKRHKKTSVCPKDGKECQLVEYSTLLFQVKKPWKFIDNRQQYYFCSDTGCDVVYFTDDGQIISINEIRNPVGHKLKGDDAIACYCFNINYQDIKKSDYKLIDFIKTQTLNKICACVSHNPSGKCCLGEIKLRLRTF